MKPKRILLFITDHQRYDLFSGLGHKVIKTPNFDRLMKEGATFTRAYTHCPLCVPARANLWTGLPCHESGIINNSRHIQLGTLCLPEFFTDSDWYTCSIGRLHFKPTRNPHGFQKMYTTDSSNWDTIDNAFISDYTEFLSKAYLKGELTDEDLYAPKAKAKDYLMPRKKAVHEKYNPTTWTVETAMNELKKCKDVPVFMNIGLIRPHPEFSAPSEWSTMYDPQDMILPELIDDENSLPKAVRNLQNREQEGIPITEFTREDILRKNMAQFYGDISHIDYELGRLIDFLKDNDMFDDTLLICTSDHGEMLGNHRLYLKNNTYDESARIPLILSWPEGIGANITVDEPVSLQDVFTTCLELLEHPFKDNYKVYRHANLLELINGQKAEEECVYIETEGGCLWAVCCVDSRYKHTFYVYPDLTWDESLYDMQSDKGEFFNLAGRDHFREICLNYRSKILKYVTRTEIKFDKVKTFVEVLKNAGF